MTIDLPAYVIGSPQELLLRACLGTGAAAIDHWRQWRRNNKLEDVDFESQCLLPMLYVKLRDLGITDPAMARYRGVYRHQWSQNQITLPGLAAIIAALDQVGIRTLLLGGASMVLHYYPEGAPRLADRWSILIPRERIESAIACLAAIGWVMTDSSRPASVAGHAVVRDALDFHDKAGRSLEIRWRVLTDHPGEATEGFWRRAQALAVLGTSSLALDRADALIYLCQWGAEWRNEARMHWVADAWHLIQTGGIDWPHLFATAQRESLVLPLRHTLRYLVEVMAAAVPDDIIAELDRVTVSSGAVDDYATRLMPVAQRGKLRKVRLHYRRYCSIVRTGCGSEPYGVCQYLRDIWNLPQQQILPLIARALGA